MPWVKHSDQRWCDPEFARLSDGAQALWFRADSYTASQLLDGFLPEDALRHMRTRKRYIDELVREGWWKRLEAGDPLAGDWRSTGGWLAAGWQERMRSKVDVVATRSEAKQRVSTNRSREQKPKFAPPDPDPVKIPDPEEKKESESARAREPSKAERRNPDPEPSFVAALPGPKSDRVRVHELLAEALGRTVDQLAPDLDSADRVARAARSETGSNATQGAFEAAVRRMLSAWQADTHPMARKHSLRNMVQHLTKYTGQTAQPKLLTVVPEERGSDVVQNPYRGGVCRRDELEEERIVHEREQRPATPEEREETLRLGREVLRALSGQRVAAGA